MTEAATIASTDARPRSGRTFRAVFSEAIPFTTSVTEASIATGAVSAGDVTVPGAALGDFVLVSAEVDLVDLVISASVTAADTVTLSIVNVTGGAVTALSAGVTFNGVVLKASDLFA